MKFQFNKYSKRAKKYFNKTRRKKIYNKFYDDVYQVDYSKCRKTKKTLGVKNRLYSNICNLTIDKLSSRPRKYSGLTLDSEFSDTNNSCYYDNKRCIIAFRGTDKTNVQHLNMDSYILFNTMRENKYFKMAEILLLRVALKYPKHKIELTGYSLGGAISLYLLDNHDDIVSRCVIFNPGISIIPYGNDVLKRYASNNKALFIIKLGDPISNGIIKYGPKHMICLKKEDKRVEELHSIYNFL